MPGMAERGMDKISYCSLSSETLAVSLRKKVIQA